MKYYKLIQDNAIIGAISSNNFVCYSPITHSFKCTDETQGEYISYQGQIYRTPWMRPIVEHIDYISVLVLEISEDEYNTYTQAIKNNEEIIEKLEEENTSLSVNSFVDPKEIGSIDFIRSSKLNEMSYACRTTIEAGLDIELRGETHHFSLDTQDQLNLMTLSTLAQTQELIPYHADGEECIFYTADEIKIIVDKTTSFKIYHTTYYNALKTYINALETIKEISAITYGTTIPEEYKSDVLKTLENQMK